MAPGDNGKGELDPTRAPALELTAVSRHFEDVLALQPTSLSLDRGTLVVVTGPNGSGKSTLLRIAGGVLQPSSGTRTCDGRALYLRAEGGGRAVERVQDAVRFTAAVTGRRGRSVDALVSAALDRVGLGEVADRRVGRLSSGQRARLVGAHLLVSQPAVACIDEPTAHLDREGTDAFVRAVRSAIDDGTTVMVATHDRTWYRPVADAVLELNAGRVVRRHVRPAASSDVPVAG